MHFSERLKEKRSPCQITKEAQIIYEILSSQEKKIALEKQLDKFFRFIPSPFFTSESQNLDSAFICAFNPCSLKISSLEKKIFLFNRLQQLTTFQELYKTFPDAKSCAMLHMLDSTYRTLMQLLPSAHFFLNNPLALNPSASVDPRETWDCFLHPLPLASKDALMQDCLINVPAYMNRRFSDQLLKALASAPADAISVFLGNRDQLDVFVKAQHPEFTLSSELKSPSSFKFFIYESKHLPGKIKVFILNVTSPSRLTHLSYILKLSGLESRAIPVWGSFDKVFAQERASLEKWSTKWAEPPKVLFLGTNISHYLGQDIKAIKSETTPSDHMLCRGNYMILDTSDGTKTPVLSFSMPNGELAGILTSFCLEKGVKSVVMIGAGGAIGSESLTPEIGDYITFSKSMLQNSCLSIPKENLHPMVQTLRTLPFGKITELHETVASPLEEDKRWLESSCTKNVSMVDVETGHIFQSFIAHLERNPAITILPGLFVSDIVNDPSNTLSEKISPKKAFAKTPELIKQIIHSINL